MATINLLTKDFVLKRVSGETILVPVEDTTYSGEGDTTPENEWQDPFGDDQNATGTGTITTAECLSQGGVPIGGFCTISTTAVVGGSTVAVTSTIAISD